MKGIIVYNYCTKQKHTLSKHTDWKDAYFGNENKQNTKKSMWMQRTPLQHCLEDSPISKRSNCCTNLFCRDLQWIMCFLYNKRGGWQVSWLFTDQDLDKLIMTASQQQNFSQSWSTVYWSPKCFPEQDSSKHMSKLCPTAKLCLSKLSKLLYSWQKNGCF